MTKGFVVIGAGRPNGVGYAIAMELLSQGCNVVTIDHPSVSLTDHPIGASDVLVADITDLAQFERSVISAVSVLRSEGTFNGAIYSAGINQMSAIQDMTVTNLQNHLTLNTVAPIMVHAWLSRMQTTLETDIRTLIVGSNTAFVARTKSSAYGASKAAIAKAARDLHRELAPQGFSVATLDPGPIFGTDMDHKTFEQMFSEGRVSDRRHYEALILKNVPGQPALFSKDVALMAAFYLLHGKYLGGTNIRFDHGQQQG